MSATHTCPDDGALRAALDEPEQFDTCDACAPRCDDMVATRDLVAGALTAMDTPEAPVDVEAGMARLRAARPDVARRQPRVPQLVASVAVLLVAAVIIATPGGRTAIASVLSTFRAERVEAVNFDPDEMDRIAALDAIADVREPEADPVTVADLGEAARIAGFTPAAVASPPDGEVTVMAAPEATMTATLSSERAPTLPADLDGAVLRIDVPGLVIQRWTGTDELPRLVVMEAGAPQVTLDGAELADFRSWVLSDPTLPPDVADQLASLGDWTTTLPIPVAEEFQRDAQVGALEAVGVDYGIMRGVVWIDGDRVHGVAGPDVLADLEAVAEALVP